MNPKTKKEFRTRRHLRMRNKIRGTADRPRMSVFATKRHMYVQFIDDVTAQTMAAASTQSAALRSSGAAPSMTTEKAKALGRYAAETAREKGIESIVFDRGGFRYGGHVRALADAAREAGLKF